MSHLHPLDPPTQHRAAERAGALAGRGLVDGPALLAAIQHAARAAAPRADPLGLSMRLAHRYGDALWATRLLRGAARRRVCAALWPLIAARAGGRALLDAADAADAACVLSAGERRAMVEDAIRRALLRRRR